MSTRRKISLLLSFIALLGVALSALAVGTSSVGLPAGPQSELVLYRIRLPRVLLGALVGAGLSTAGVAFQAILRNPLADPYVVGVAGGAALGGVLALVLGISMAAGLPLFAFAGAALSTFFLFGLARARGRTDPLTILLVGVIFNAFAAAVVTFLKTVVSADKAQEILFWLMGAIGVLPTPLLISVTVYVSVGLISLLLLAGPLNLLSSGDDEAATLGLPVERVRVLAFLAGALLVGAVVAVSGMIGFVGLVVPHVMRRLVGADHRWLLPSAAIGGAAFLLVADALARLTFLGFGTEVPVGAVTAFAGGPFFLALLLRRGG